MTLIVPYYGHRGAPYLRTLWEIVRIKKIKRGTIEASGSLALGPLSAELCAAPNGTRTPTGPL